MALQSASVGYLPAIIRATFAGEDPTLVHRGEEQKHWDGIDEERFPVTDYFLPYRGIERFFVWGSEAGNTGVVDPTASSIPSCVWWVRVTKKLGFEDPLP